MAQDSGQIVNWLEEDPFTVERTANRQGKRKFIGFSFTGGPEVKRSIAPKALECFKRRVRDITRRAKGVSLQGYDGRAGFVPARRAFPFSQLLIRAP